MDPGRREASRERREARRRVGADTLPSPAGATVALVPSAGDRLAYASNTAERQELLCSVLGLAVKLGLVAVIGVSLARLTGAYQQRMESQSEIAAVLEVEKAKLAKARDRFDQLFMAEGEQRLIREQSQWIAPNRLRVVWQSQDTPAASPLPTVETRSTPTGNRRPAP